MWNKLSNSIPQTNMIGISQEEPEEMEEEEVEIREEGKERRRR